ncbi:LPXTG cell wall anchor domain-containing protein [Streptococcus porcinus]|uniref:LPXTG cell wall anchor domain-containing protein n=1 Tax=Streptococcus porcinus TaxID=1340 RepID=A0A7V9WTD3_STRPO|nr:LPXTG cell wall anchor domain-containing protein [Streptococcus porcinus]MBA2796709.1 LPXTG cell wall anchor domain-containing protein [Streptococcus porcinus]
MIKKQLLLMATVSSVVLLGSRVNADDVVPTDPSTPTPGVVVPAPTPDVPATDPVVPTPEPSTPAPVPDVPATDPTPGTDSSTPIPTEPNTEPSTPAPAPEKPAEPKPSEEPKPDEVKPGEVTPDVIDKADPNTGSVTIKPVPVTPGKTIIGTQDSSLIVQDSQGNQSIVSATTYGGRVNDNGTVTIKDIDGKEKTLPSTGEKASVLTYVGMALTTILALVFKNKKLQ